MGAPRKPGGRIKTLLLVHELNLSEFSRDLVAVVAA